MGFSETQSAFQNDNLSCDLSSPTHREHINQFLQERVNAKVVPIIPTQTDKLLRSRAAHQIKKFRVQELQK